jgi:hypothetical protein
MPARAQLLLLLLHACIGCDQVQLLCQCDTDTFHNYSFTPAAGHALQLLMCRVMLLLLLLQCFS